MRKEELKSQLKMDVETLMFGDKKDFKEVKRNIKRLWNHETESFRKVAPFVLEYIQKFDEIKKSENKAAFISGIDLFFLSLADDYFDELKDFTIKAIQNQNGAVRQSITHTFTWLDMSLYSRINPFDYRNKKTKEMQLIEKEIAKKQLFNLVNEIEDLIERYNDENEKAEYVDEMKPSVNKNLQILWNKLTGGSHYRKLMEQTKPVSSELFFKRKEIENELAELLKRSKSFADIDLIKNTIYNENDSEDFRELIMIFDTGYKTAPEMHEILEVINDAWNYFPHKCLNGLCPVEMVENYRDSI